MIRKSSLFDQKTKTQATKPANKQKQKEQNAIKRPVASAKICGNIVQSSSTRQSLSDGLKVKGWLAIAKLKPLSLFISQLLMLKKAFDNVKIEK